jgi:hypothetical protein
MPHLLQQGLGLLGVVHIHHFDDGGLLSGIAVVLLVLGHHAQLLVSVPYLLQVALEGIFVQFGKLSCGHAQEGLSGFVVSVDPDGIGIVCYTQTEDVSILGVGVFLSAIVAFGVFLVCHFLLAFGAANVVGLPLFHGGEEADGLRPRPCGVDLIHCGV